MVREELVKWIKDGMAKGHDLEKLLSHLKAKGYAEVEIIELRNHFRQKSATSGGTLSQIFRWTYGVFTEPEATMKQIAEHSRMIHVALMGFMTTALIFLTFVLKDVLLEGAKTLPVQVLDKFTLTLAPQGVFSALLSFSELTIKGSIVHVVVTLFNYFLPLLGIAFAAHLLLHGLYHKSTMWKAYKIIGVPFGSVSMAIGAINLAILPFLFIAEQVGMDSFLAKTLSSVIVGVIALMVFLIIVVSLYSYAAYAMAIKEKYETTLPSAVLISAASTGAVVLALLPLVSMFVASVF